MPVLASVALVKTGVSTMWLGRAQYRLIIFMCGSWKMELWHDGKPTRRNPELRMFQFGYWKTKTRRSGSFPHSPRLGLRREVLALSSETYVMSIYHLLGFHGWHVIGEQNCSEYRTLTEAVTLRSPCAGVADHVDSKCQSRSRISTKQ